ncbi:Phenol hydroxylase subunit [Hydrogenophaga sp. T4]|jgi:phenol hydroxylase P0 protein|nr:Phenol hydroxylase subunit [Hydrogenophaga sp. T4]
MLTMKPIPDAPAESGETILLRKFVRVIAERDDGLITFEFSIGWPELVVELMLPAQAFAEFCARERVERLNT